MIESSIENNIPKNENVDNITFNELNESFENQEDDGVSLEELYQEFKEWVVNTRNDLIEGIIGELPVSVIQLLAEQGLLDNIADLGPNAFVQVDINTWQQIDVRNITPENIKELPPVFIENMSNEQLGGLSSDQIKEMNPSQTHNLSGERLSSFGEKLSALNPETTQSLSGAQLQGLAERGQLGYISPDMINQNSLAGWGDYSILPPNYISHIPVEEFKTIDLSGFTLEQLAKCTQEQLAVMPYDNAKIMIEKVLPQKIDWKAIEFDALENGALNTGIGMFGGPETAVGAGIAGAVVGAFGELTRQQLIMHGVDKDTAQHVETMIDTITPAGVATSLVKEGGEQLVKHEVAKVAKDKVDNVVESEVKNSDDLVKIKELSPYSDEVTKTIRNVDEVKIYQDQNLKECLVNDRLTLKDTTIDPSIKDGMGQTNLERMEKGKAPLDADGKPYNLHHIGQEKDSPLAELKYDVHKTYDSILHDKSKPSEVHGADSDVNWSKERSDHWKARAEEIKGDLNV